MQLLGSLAANHRQHLQVTLKMLEPSLCSCRAMHKPKLPASEPLLVQLFSSLPSMPTRQGAGSLPYTVAMLIGVYADWLASTLRTDGHGQALVAQLMQLLMQCKTMHLGLPCRNLVLLVVLVHSMHLIVNAVILVPGGRKTLFTAVNVFQIGGAKHFSLTLEITS